VVWSPKHDRTMKGEQQAKIMACGGGDQQMQEAELEAAESPK
jgi:hypothetical protein